MDIAKIRQYAELLREMELTALEIRADGTVRLEQAAAPVRLVSGIEPTIADSKSRTQAAQTDEAGVSVITSPIVGMFYIAPAENAEPFVQVGSTVHKGDVLCIIEAMKLMNEITAESNGVITEILAVNGAVVEFGQSLFRMRKEQQ